MRRQEAIDGRAAGRGRRMSREEELMPGIPAGLVDWEALTAPEDEADEPEAMRLDAEDTIGEPEDDDDFYP